MAYNRCVGGSMKKRLVKIWMFLLAWSPTHSQKFANHELHKQDGVSLCVTALNRWFSYYFLYEFKVAFRNLWCLLTFKVTCARELHCQFNLLLPNIYIWRGSDKSFPIHTLHVIYDFVDLYCISFSISSPHQFSSLKSVFHFSRSLHGEWMVPYCLEVNHSSHFSLCLFLLKLLYLFLNRVIRYLCIIQDESRRICIAGHDVFSFFFFFLSLCSFPNNS